MPRRAHTHAVKALLNQGTEAYNRVTMYEKIAVSTVKGFVQYVEDNGGKVDRTITDQYTNETSSKRYAP